MKIDDFASNSAMNANILDKIENFTNPNFDIDEIYSENRIDQQLKFNNENCNEKKIDHFETKSNSHSYNNSTDKSELNFKMEHENSAKAYFNNLIGKIKNFIKCIF